MTPLELLAALFGLLCVVLTMRQHIGCWPAGLVQVSLYIVVFYRAKLYSDVLLHVVYVVLQFYGWYLWLHGGPDRTPLVVTRVSGDSLGRWLATVAIGTAVIGGAMHHWTDAALPYPDAFIAAASLVAQWWMNRKWLESWLMWIVVDVVGIGVYLAKDLYPTAVLYGVFLVLAVMGWRQWKRALLAPATA